MFLLELLLLQALVLLLFARTRETARKDTGGAKPKQKLATREARATTRSMLMAQHDMDGDDEDDEDADMSYQHHRPHTHTPFITSTSSMHTSSDNIIPCDVCDACIPFHLYQQHMSTHTSTSTSSSAQHVHPPGHIGSRHTRSSSSLSTVTTFSSLTSTSASSSSSSQSLAASTMILPYCDHFDDVMALLSPSMDTSTPAYIDANTQEHVIKTARLRDEKMFTHKQLPHPPSHPVGSCRLSLRSPLPHEPGFDEDVVYCLFTGKEPFKIREGDHAHAAYARPPQPPDDELVLLPMLGLCRFVGFAPFCMEYDPKLDLVSRTHWRFKNDGDGASMGTIVEIIGMKWAQSQLPVRLLLDINNINGYLPLNSHWRLDITHFILYHQLNGPSNTVPSFKCQVDNCYYPPIHYSRDEPMLGICADHLTSLGAMDQRMYRYPPQFSLPTLLSQLLMKLTGTSTSPSAFKPHRSSRRLAFHMVSLLTKEENMHLERFLYRQVEARYREGAGNIVLAYIGAKTGNKSIFQEYIGKLVDDLTLSCLDDSRFFRSKHFILFMSLTMHSDGAGHMHFSYGQRTQTSASSSVCIDLSTIFRGLPPSVDCPIILCVGSCTHSHSTYTTLREQVLFQMPHVAKNLYLIFCAGDAEYEPLASLQLTFIKILMEDDTMPVPDAFSDVAKQPIYRRMHPRMVCPDGLIIVPQSVQPIKDPIPHTLLHPLSVLHNSLVCTATTSTVPHEQQVPALLPRAVPLPLPLPPLPHQPEQSLSLSIQPQPYPQPQSMPLSSVSTSSSSSPAQPHQPLSLSVSVSPSVILSPPFNPYVMPLSPSFPHAHHHHHRLHPYPSYHPYLYPPPYPDPRFHPPPPRVRHHHPGHPDSTHDQRSRPGRRTAVKRCRKKQRLRMQQQSHPQ